MFEILGKGSSYLEGKVLGIPQDPQKYDFGGLDQIKEGRFKDN